MDSHVAHPTGVTVGVVLLKESEKGSSKPMLFLATLATCWRPTLFKRPPSRYGSPRTRVRPLEYPRHNYADRQHSWSVRMLCPMEVSNLGMLQLIMTLAGLLPPMYVLFVVGNREMSLKWLIFFFHSLLASSVGLIYLIPLRSQCLMTSVIHLPCTSMVVGPFESRVGPWGP